MARNPLIRRKEKSYSTPMKNQSAGILDDHAVRKNVATKEGTIEHTPTASNHITNKQYVDDNDHDPVTVIDSSTINFTLAGQDITAVTIDSAIDHDALLNFVADEHIDWTGTTRDFQTSGTITIQDSLPTIFLRNSDTSINEDQTLGLVRFEGNESEKLGGRLWAISTDTWPSSGTFRHPTDIHCGAQDANSGDSTTDNTWTLDEDGNFSVAQGNITVNNGVFVGDGSSITNINSEKSWAFDSPSGSSGTFYFDGFYDFASSDNDFNPSINFGTANAAHGAHFFVVCASGATDTQLTITGTSITDSGVRTTSDTQVLSLNNAAAGSMFETTKKWIGQITVNKTAGTDRLCNYGFTKYWDSNNTDFQVKNINVTWLGGANDSGADIILRHHKATGWTYNAGSTPTPPTPIASMQADYVTEFHIVNGQNGAYKEGNLATNINGAGEEGTIIEIVTTANKTFELGNVIMRIENL